MLRSLTSIFPSACVLWGVLLLGGCRSAEPATPQSAPQSAPAPRSAVQYVAPQPAPQPAPPVVPNRAPIAVRSVTTARGSALPERNTPLDRVLARAAETRRPALLYFCAAWCGYCSKMNRETLQRHEVLTYIADHFVAVEYDVDTPLGREVAQRYGANGYPTLVIVDASGRATKTIIGARQPQAFLSMLRSAAP